jgi:hypothetical protein
MVTIRGLRSTMIPCLANLYKGRPLCFSAENIGGICEIVPRKADKTVSS